MAAGLPVHAGYPATAQWTLAMSRARAWLIRSSSTVDGNAPGCENTSTPWRQIMSVGIDLIPAAAAR